MTYLGRNSAEAQHDRARKIKKNFSSEGYMMQGYRHLPEVGNHRIRMYHIITASIGITNANELAKKIIKKTGMTKWQAYSKLSNITLYMTSGSKIGQAYANKYIKSLG
jgi:hypothetical protein